MKLRPSHQANLRRMIRETRAEKPVDIDWRAVEEQLLRRARTSVPAATTSRYPLAWAVLVAAAGLFIWGVSTRPQGTLSFAPRAPAEAAAASRLNADAVALGERVLAEAGEVSVHHDQRATWTLSRNSHARLISKGELITVLLERGSLLADVVPNSQPETFVVEAADARIAVHGTVFRVELVNDRVNVSVREGTVAVGARGAAPSFILKAPAQGAFSLDGTSGSLDEPTATAPAESNRTARAPHAAAQRGPLVAASRAGEAGGAAGLPQEPSISSIEQGVARIVDSAADCFTRHTPQGAEGVNLTLKTALTLQISGAGAVLSADFQPPLSPVVSACAHRDIARVAFAPSLDGVEVTRLLELKR